jgi:hypothetical protein
LLRLRIKASRWIIPSGFTLQGDHRRLAYLVKGIRWLRESERDQAVRTNAVTVGN